MTFYPSKKRIFKIKLSGGIVILMLFTASCYLNISSGGKFPPASIFLFLLSIASFIMVYSIIKRVSAGILTANKKGIEFIAGFRRLSAPWNNIEKYGIYENEIKGIKQNSLGITFKKTDMFPENIRKLLELNKTSSGSHLSFYKGIFEKDSEEILKYIKELQNTPEES